MGEHDLKLVGTSKEVLAPEGQSERFDEALPLASALLNTESFLSSVRIETPINRRRAAVAVQMLKEAYILKATELSEAIIPLARGEKIASNFGFPEFDDNAVESTFN